MGNTFKTAFLLTALTLLLMVVGRALGGPNGMLLALGIAVVTNFVAYFFSDKIALQDLSRSTGDARAVAARLQRGRAADPEDRPADAEDLRDSDRFAERFCHRPQPEACFGRGHARAF